jgi:hypothetical protein
MAKTKKGVKPTERKPRVPGTGRNIPAKGYNSETKQWERGRGNEPKCESMDGGKEGVD